jgi:outer membrane protein assembly factor BamA
VPYITDIELDGMVKASRESVLTALKVRFGVALPEISERLETIEDLDVLGKLLEQAILTASVQEFQVTHIPHPNCHKSVFTDYFLYKKSKIILAVSCSRIIYQS